MSDVFLVLTTMPDTAAAEALARTLVEERLAACVNVHGPMVSVYRWQGQVEREAEHQVVIKTTGERVAAVQRRVAELHPYELPELLVVAVSDGSEGYLAWVGENSGGLS
jgi:periplasmic divalent cation tolerance protein